VFTGRTSVGLDVHPRSVVAAAFDGDTGEVFRRRLTPGRDDVIGWVRSLPGLSAVVCEAGPTGFGLVRAFVGVGVRCEVAAPSKTQRLAGDRVKTDLLTELPGPNSRVGVRLPIGIATFPAHGQRRGWVAGVVRVGGASGRVARGDRGPV